MNYGQTFRVSIVILRRMQLLATSFVPTYMHGRISYLLWLWLAPDFIESGLFVQYPSLTTFRPTLHLYAISHCLLHVINQLGMCSFISSVNAQVVDSYFITIRKESGQCTCARMAHFLTNSSFGQVREKRIVDQRPIQRRHEKRSRSFSSCTCRRR